MHVLIKAEGFVREGIDCPHVGQYLKAFDHDAEGGRGYGTFTKDASKAMKFTDHKTALDFWNKQSTVKPLRPDGRPNKPLTCLSITLVAIRD